MRGLTAALLLLFSTAVWGEEPLGNVRFAHAAGAPVEAAVFPHWAHRLRFTCNACHPALFPMGHDLAVTMDEIRDGKACGRCHDGRVAFAVTPTTCNRCHAPPGP